MPAQQLNASPNCRSVQTQKLLNSVQKFLVEGLVQRVAFHRNHDVADRVHGGGLGERNVLEVAVGAGERHALGVGRGVGVPVSVLHVAHLVF